jgi:hypothetical protein
VRYLLAQQLERATAHVFQVYAIRLQGRALIKEDGNGKFPSDPLASLMGQLHTIVKSHSANRHKRQYIRSTKPRVLPRVMAHVDQFSGQCDSPHRCLDNHLRRRHKGDDRTVMIWVHVCVQHAGGLHPRDRACQATDYFGLATLAKVGYTLDKSIANCQLPIADF